MTTTRKIGKVLTIAAYAACGAALAITLLPGLGWKALEVATGSMTPAVPQGSLVLVHRVPYPSIRVGDIVTYKSPANLKQTITHRVVSTGATNGIATFVTKGDANASADRPIVGGAIVGKVLWHLPYLGRVVDWLRSPLGIAILLILPGIVIILSELRRLWRALAEPPAGAEHTTMPLMSSSSTPLAARRRYLDGIGPAIAVVAVLVLTTHTTLAQLNARATLKSTTITIASRANHLVIARVALGSAPLCSSGDDRSVIITGSGAKSVANVTISDNCNVKDNTTSNVTVSQTSYQDAASGAVVVSNTTSGSSSSGNSSNTSTQTTSVVIGGGKGAAQAHWFVLYNPTSRPIDLTGWSVHDNSSIVDTLPSRVIAPRASLTIFGSSLSGAKIGNGLTPAGDRLVLLDRSGAAVDALSWGSDTSAFNPSVPALSPTGEAYRRNPNYDTDASSDWAVQI